MIQTSFLEGALGQIANGGIAAKNAKRRKAKGGLFCRGRRVGRGSVGERNSILWRGGGSEVGSGEGFPAFDDAVDEDDFGEDVVAGNGGAVEEGDLDVASALTEGAVVPEGLVVPPGAAVDPGGGGLAVGLATEDFPSGAPGDVHGVFVHPRLDFAFVHELLEFGGEAGVTGGALVAAGFDGIGLAGGEEQQEGEQQEEAGGTGCVGGGGVHFS